MAKYVISLVTRGFLPRECENKYGVARQEITYLLIAHEHKVMLLL